MFLVYINSLPKGVNSTVRIFADDTVIYREISAEEDHHTLQADLDTLVQWEREFSMEFHPKKCNILRVSRSRCPSTYNYTLHGTTLKEWEEVKYLGITITKDLSWEKHIGSTQLSPVNAFIQLSSAANSKCKANEDYKRCSGSTKMIIIFICYFIWRVLLSQPWSANFPFSDIVQCWTHICTLSPK